MKEKYVSFVTFYIYKKKLQTYKKYKINLSITNLYYINFKMFFLSAKTLKLNYFYNIIYFLLILIKSS